MITQLKSYAGNDSVFTTNARSMKIENVCRSVASNLILKEILLVPESKKSPFYSAIVYWCQNICKIW